MNQRIKFWTLDLDFGQMHIEHVEPSFGCFLAFLVISHKTVAEEYV